MGAEVGRSLQIAPVHVRKKKRVDLPQMENRDRASSLFWIGFGIVFCVGGLKHGLTKSGIPGPGCLPFLVGLILVSLSLMLLVSSLLKRKTADKSFPQIGRLKRLSIATLSLIFFGVALKEIGYLLTTFLFMMLVLRFIEPQRWRVSFLFALLTAMISWAFFMVLKVELPRGILGI